MKFESRVQGLLVGQMAGDAFGAPFEFMSFEEFLKNAAPYPNGLIVAPHINPKQPNKFGYSTDDTEHLVVVAESFAQLQRFDMDDISKRLVQWYAGGSAWGLGGSTAIACKLMDPDEVQDPVHWSQAGKLARELSPYFHKGRNNEQGYEISSVPSNGPLMRASIIGLFASGATLEKAAKDLTSMTHDYDINFDTSVALADLVSLAVSGKSKEEVRQEFEKRHMSVIVECELALRPEMGEAMGKTSNGHSKDPKQYGHGGSAAVTLGIVIKSFFETDSFEDALVNAMNARTTFKPWCWDVDTYTAITGAVAGAFYGVEKIPEHFTRPISPFTDQPVDITPHSFEDMMQLGTQLTKAIELSRPLSR